MSVRSGSSLLRTFKHGAPQSHCLTAAWTLGLGLGLALRLPRIAARLGDRRIDNDPAGLTWRGFAVLLLAGAARWGLPDWFRQAEMRQPGPLNDSST
jgi:hypothetical protein